MSIMATTGAKPSISERLHIDIPLLLGLLAIMSFSLVIMYSASGQSVPMMERQAMRMVLSLGVMLLLAQIAPRRYEAWAPYLFGIGYYYSLVYLPLVKYQKAHNDGLI